MTNRNFVATQIVSGRMKSPRQTTSWWPRHCLTVESYSLAERDEDRHSIRQIVGNEAREWEDFRLQSPALATLIAEHSGLEMGLADATRAGDLAAIDKAGLYLMENLREQVPLLEAIEGFPSSLYFNLVGQHVALYTEWLRLGPLRRGAKQRGPGAPNKMDWIERRRANTLSLAYVNTEWL